MSALAKLKRLSRRSLEPFINQIVQGDCVEVMREFPSESVDMVMTSPPYWGLRNYGEATETVWGGDPNCQHEWAEEPMTLVHENRNFSKGTQEQVHKEKPTTYIKKYDDQKAAFCVKCGAWRGQLGLEPTWQMYVEHMVSICRQIKRVLKRTGSMYLVLGDTYAGSHCGKGDKTLFQNYRRLKVAGNLYSKPSPQAQTQDYQPKCLMGIPWRVAFTLIEDGWILRNDVIWRKPNAMPSSVKDRLTQTYEHIFHFVKQRKYFYDLDAIRQPHKSSSLKRAGISGVVPFNLRVRDVKRGKKGVFVEGGKVKRLRASEKEVEGYVYPEKPFQAKKKPYVENNPHRMRLEKQKFLALDPSRPMDLSHPKGKNPGDFWSINTKPFKGAHFAVYPEAICVRPIKSSCPPDGVVLDPMCGSGTTLVVAKKLGRRWIGIDINPKYCKMARKRLD